MRTVALAPAEIAMMRSVFRHHPGVAEVRLFGSRAKGTHTSRSDVDLALFGNVGPLEAEAIAAELDDLPLPYKYDVQAFESIRADALREHIQRVGVLLYPKTAPQLQPENGASAEDIEACFQSLLEGRKDLWSALRDASPGEIRALITLALRETNGSYKKVASLFHVDDRDYRRLMDSLRRKQCIIDFRLFQKMPSRVS